MKGIVIVAHDDDVVLWMGGTIRSLSSWDWHLISMCNAQNEDRKGYFRSTSSKLGATCDTFDFCDYQTEEIVDKGNSITDMKHNLLNLLVNKRYDYVFTHSRDPNGEYGFHANHREVCQSVQALVSMGHLTEKPSNIAYFCYYPIYGLTGIPTVAKVDAKFYVQLSYSNLAFKLDLICSHKEDIVDNLEQNLGSPCPNPEAFEGDSLDLPAPFIRRPP